MTRQQTEHYIIEVLADGDGRAVEVDRASERKLGNKFLLEFFFHRPPYRTVQAAIAGRAGGGERDVDFRISLNRAGVDKKLCLFSADAKR